MTVSATNAHSTGTGNGSATAFPFTFKAMATSEIAVYVDDALVASSAYSVSLSSSGGTVTFDMAPANGAAVLIVSEPDFAQDIDFANNGAFLADTHDEANDRGAVRSIWARARLAILFASTMLSSSGRAGKFLAWNASGDPILSDGTGSDTGMRTDLASTDAGKGAALVKRSDGLTVQEAASKEPLKVDAYYQSADGDDWAPAWTRAIAAALTARRGVIATADAEYELLTSIEVEPDTDSWTPPIDLNNCTLYLGPETGATASHEAAGIRVRGKKSGFATNATSVRIKNGTIDARELNVSNGARGIFMENASGVRIENVNGRNYKFGNHILNYCFLECGSASNIEIRNCRATGYVLPDSSDANRWFAVSHSGDQTVAMPGDTVTDGQTVVIGTISANDFNTSANVPYVATLYYWTNSTGSSVVLPAVENFTAAYLSGTLGLTQGGTTKVVTGVTKPAGVAEYIESQGARIPGPVARHTGIDLINCKAAGGYYGFYGQGVVNYRVIDCRSDSTIRGIVCEWNCTGVELLGCTIEETYSSGVLFGYGIYKFTIDGVTVDNSDSGRWVGEALFNIQLNAQNGTIRNITTRTQDSATGQYHLNISVNCKDIAVSKAVLRGDCAKGYVVVQTAWNAALASANTESYSDPGFTGAASTAAVNITLDGVEVIADTTDTTAPAAFAWIQGEDTGIGSGCAMRNCAALSTKHTRHFKIYEAASAPATDGVNSFTLENCKWPAQTTVADCITKMPLPRGWAHFDGLPVNVPNLDDGVERAMPTVATPSLIYGKYWLDQGGTAFDGWSGGKAGRVIYVRGSGSARAIATTSGSAGVKDGLRPKTSPTTPGATDLLQFNYQDASGLLAWFSRT